MEISLASDVAFSEISRAGRNAKHVGLTGFPGVRLSEPSTFEKLAAQSKVYCATFPRSI
jgi:hypothetical protein